MDLFLKGKTAVVTGASQGLGRAITKELAMEGVTVLAVARNESLLNELKTEVAAAGGIVPVTLVQDLVAADGPQKIAAAALISWGILIYSLIMQAEAARSMWWELMKNGMRRCCSILNVTGS